MRWKVGDLGRDYRSRRDAGGSNLVGNEGWMPPFPFLLELPIDDGPYVRQAGEMLQKHDVFLDRIATVIPNVKAAHHFNRANGVLEVQSQRCFNSGIRGLATLDLRDFTRCRRFYCGRRHRTLCQNTRLE
jgi:hypothetical protein